jgi:hypothetical protein
VSELWVSLTDRVTDQCGQQDDVRDTARRPSDLVRVTQVTPLEAQPWLVEQVRKRLATMQPKGVRQRIVAAASLGYRNRDAIHYTQNVQPAQGPCRMQGVREQIRPPRFPHFEDCSSFATWCYWAAGAPDPNGLGYNGSGFTGTQVEHGRVTADPRPGDLVFYGGTASVPAHVAVYVGNGRVVSHGSDAAPFLLAVDYRPINQIRTYVP